MADTGWISAGLGQSIAFGSQSWYNPTYIYISDNNRARAPLSQDEDSHYLRATTFGFAIPDGAVIDGIEVRIEKYTNVVNTIEDNSCKIVKAGSEQGAEKGQAYWSTTEAYVYYGGAADKWGLTWTPAQINASNFGVSLSAINYESSIANAYVDHVQIKVYYIEPSTNMKINIGDSWKTVEEIKINVGDSWKTVTKIQINIGDVWKTIFG